VRSVLCWVLRCVFEGVSRTLSGNLWRDDRCGAF